MSDRNIVCQENLLSGRTDLERWQSAQELGFDAIELRGLGGLSLVDRQEELQRARQHGAQYSSACAILDCFPGSGNSDDRKRAVREISSQLEVIAELGGSGVVTPASFGEASGALPPRPGLPAVEERREALTATLAILAQRANALGVSVILEPINRYENDLVLTLSQAAAMLDAVDLPGLVAMADSFHMNIEERDPFESLRVWGSRVRHVHVSDTNRCAPGQGHFDWPQFVQALDNADYRGPIVLECELSEQDSEVALRRAIALLK